MISHSVACDALTKQRCIELRYDGFSRIVEVHSVGVSTAHHEIMRVWQVRGGSVHNEPVGWKLLRLDEVTGATLTNEKSSAPRLGYKRGDRDMIQIFCQV